MATFITYGPLSFERCVIKRLTCEPVYTDDRVNLRYHKYTISFSAYLHPTQNNYKIVNPGGQLEIGGRVAASYSAQAVFWWMNQPRQYFRLDFDDHRFLEIPTRPIFKSDAALGPRCFGISVVEATGAPGYSGGVINGAGGHFLVNATIEVCYDPLGDSPGNDNILIQGYSMTCVHDLNGDNWLTTRTTQIKVNMRPDALYSIPNPDRTLISRWLAPIATLAGIPRGYRRNHARTEVLTSMTDAMMMFVDEETGLDAGANSPSISFRPVQHYSVGIGKVEQGKEAAWQGGMMLQIQASYTPYDESAREHVIEQCFYWIMAMGQGGGAPGLSQSQHFRCYTDVSISIDFQACVIQVSARIVMAPSVGGDFRGSGGLPLNLNAFHLRSTTQDIDIYQAQLPALDGEEIALGFSFKNPVPPEGYHGPQILEIIQKTLQWANLPFDQRHQPDGFERFCGGSPVPVNPTGPSEHTLASGGNLTLSDIISVPLFTVPDLSMGQTSDDQAYESTWQTTSYRTKTGDAVLPLGGTMPGYVGSGTPPDAVAVTLHRPNSQKLVTWGIHSIGPTPPKYPSKVTGDPNDVYVSSIIEPAARIPVSLGIYAWTISGTYYFDRIVTRQPGDILPTGHLPIETASTGWDGSAAQDGRLPGVA
jgi:hypothetical protein